MIGENSQIYGVQCTKMHLSVKYLICRPGITLPNFLPSHHLLSRGKGNYSFPLVAPLILKIFFPQQKGGQEEGERTYDMLILMTSQVLKILYFTCCVKPRQFHISPFQILANRFVYFSGVYLGPCPISLTFFFFSKIVKAPFIIDL